MYFHRTVRDRTAVYCACICANDRISAQVVTFPLTFAVKRC